MKINEFVTSYGGCPFCKSSMQLKITKGSGAISKILVNDNILSFQTIAREWPLSSQSYHHVWKTLVNLDNSNVSVDYIDVTTNLPTETISLNAIDRYIQSNKARKIYYACEKYGCFDYNVDGFMDLNFEEVSANVIGVSQNFRINEYFVSNNIFNDTVDVRTSGGDLVRLEYSYWSPDQIKSGEVQGKLDCFHLFA